MTAPPAAAPSPLRGRLLILLAAILWSTSGIFIPLLRNPTRLGLHAPEVLTWHIAFYRIFFAGVVLVPTLRRRDITWRRAMLPMALAFAVMNGLLMQAMSRGRTSDALLLQYTAPMWAYVFAVGWLGEAPDRRSLISILIGLIGVAAIVWGGWQSDQSGIVFMALVSGVAYAVVLTGLRLLRDESPRWLTVLNHLTAALAVAPVLAFIPLPSLAQLACLAVFGTVQMALPYWLMTRGLRSVSPQEAGTLTLLEPLLNPIWAYLIAPEQQRPTVFTYIGGAFILGALLFRYLPSLRKRRQAGPQPESIAAPRAER